MFLSPWLRALKSTLHRRPQRLSGRTVRPVQVHGNLLASHVELLEDRALLSVTSEFNPFFDRLEIRSDSNDDIAVTVVSGNVLVNNQSPDTGILDADSVVSLLVIGGPGENLIDLRGVQYRCW